VLAVRCGEMIVAIKITSARPAFDAFHAEHHLQRHGYVNRIDLAAARQFDGAVDCRFERTGLRCKLSLFVPKDPEREIVDLAAPSPRLRSETPLPPARAV
jgi:hypothetical protein